jgi:hypothetical protein
MLTADEVYLIFHGDPISWTKYVTQLRHRNPLVEPYLMRVPRARIHYAEHIVQGRWPEAEPYIMQSPNEAYSYAASIIHGRWPEAEPIIQQDPSDAYLYAKYVIKGRWPEAEGVIRQNQDAWKWYTEQFPEANT